MDFVNIFIHDTSWGFIGEILIRCFFMFVMIILFLRLTGKRGVRQLSIFELTIILSLGSIAGDPMFTKDLPLIQAFIVMCTIIFLYRITTWLIMKYQPFEDLLEGKALYILKDGELLIEDIEKGKYSHDEFFSEMRQQGTEHLGQIRTGLLESDGKFSILFYSPDEVRYGLPIFPGACKIQQSVQPHTFYACTYCGHVKILDHHIEVCPRCQCNQWYLAIKCPRV